jgi:hypothetical protein
MHGARAVQSSPGGGSVFTLVLPLHAAPQAGATEDGAPEARMAEPAAPGAEMPAAPMAETPAAPAGAAPEARAQVAPEITPETPAATVPGLLRRAAVTR